MMSLTLPRRRLWGNLHGRCEAPGPPLRPPVFFSPRSSLSPAAWFGSLSERGQSAPIQGALNKAQARWRVRRHRASQQHLANLKAERRASTAQK